jgi:hypothetical protein
MTAERASAYHAWLDVSPTRRGLLSPQEAGRPMTIADPYFRASIVAARCRAPAGSMGTHVACGIRTHGLRRECRPR